MVGFTFTSGTATGPVLNGERSVLLEVQTSATTFTNGEISLQDGFAGSGSGFAPVMFVAATPEPASILLLGTALMVLGVVPRRFARRR